MKKNADNLITFQGQCDTLGSEGVNVCVSTSPCILWDGVAIVSPSVTESIVSPTISGVGVLSLLGGILFGSV
jgi:hypothetical protein